MMRWFALSLCGAIAGLQAFAAPEPAWAADDGGVAPSPAVIVALEKFRNIGLPGYFAVSEDGSASGYALCRTDGDCGRRAQELALRFCAEAASGRTCRIFADANSRLWRGDVTMPAADDLDLVRRGWRVFTTRIFWPDGSPASHGWSIMAEGAPVGWVKISPAGDGGPCFGTFAAKDINHGRWQLACRYDLTASGSYVRETDRWILKGNSEDGDKVRIETTFR